MQIEFYLVSYIIHIYTSFSLQIVGTVASTIDTTKNVASSAVDKGLTLVGSAKGKFYQSIRCYIFILLHTLEL